MSHRFTVDEILTVLVNISHSLSSDSPKLFEMAQEEFLRRMTLAYDPVDQKLFLQPEDYLKILITLQSFG